MAKPFVSPYRYVAHVTKPHGRTGEVLVCMREGLPFCLKEGMHVTLVPPQLHKSPFCIVEKVVVPHGGHTARVSFSGVDTMDAADALRGCHILVRRRDLELGPLDVPFDELIGREVYDRSIGELGVIREIIETPAHNIWVCTKHNGVECMLPVIETLVSIIPDRGGIEVHIPADLLDSLNISASVSHVQKSM